MDIEMFLNYYMNPILPPTMSTNQLEGEENIVYVQSLVLYQ